MVSHFSVSLIEVSQKNNALKVTHVDAIVMLVQGSIKIK